MKVKTATLIVLLIAAIPVVADDAPQPSPDIQAINAKYEKQADAAQRAYWQAIVAVDRAKLKDLQQAMITAAKESNADLIPIIQRAIEETKAKITQDANESGSPTALHPTADFHWLEGTTWRLKTDSRFALTFNPNHTLVGSDNGTWKVLDTNIIAVKREHLEDTIWIFGRNRKQAMDEPIVAKSVPGSIFIYDGG